MKISKIIILSFVTFVLISTLVLFIDSKGHKKNIFGTDMSIKMETIGNFNVLAAEPGSDIHVNQNDSNYIRIEYSNDRPINKNLYRLSNDTLFVGDGNRIFIDCKQLKSVITHNNIWLSIDSLQTDSLYFESNGGVHNIGFDNMKVKIQYLNFVSNKKSWNSIGATDIKFLKVTLKDSAYLQVNKFCKAINADLTQSSEFSVRSSPSTLNYKKDDDSKVIVY
jgi:hypothetical protein